LRRRRTTGAIPPDSEEETMPRAKELRIRVPDHPGMLGEIASALGEKKINIRAVNGWVEGGEGVVRIVADPNAAAKKILAGRGWRPEEEEVLEIEVPDKPGALGQVAMKLGAAGVNIEHVFVGTAGARKATLFLKVSDLTAAMKALR
jgi:hypothetical protein